MLAADLSEKRGAVWSALGKRAASAPGACQYLYAALPDLGVFDGLFKHRYDVRTQGSTLGHGDLLGLPVQVVWDLANV